MKVANSQRLRYRLMSVEDVELLFELDQDPEVMRYITQGKTTTRDQIESTIIPRMQAYTHPDKGWGLWAMETLDNNDFLGWILVRPMDFFTDTPDYYDIELGWRLHRSTWGQGYGFEAAQAVVTELAKQTDIKTFTALAVPENVGSIGIMKKLGMTFLKTEDYDIGDGPREVVYYQRPRLI